jgi:hypothetical protein
VHGMRREPRGDAQIGRRNGKLCFGVKRRHGSRLSREEEP